MPAGASFIPEDFDLLIENHGYNVRWKQAMVCECMQDGQPDIHCPLCNGSGYRYIKTTPIKVVSTSFGGNQVLKIQGLSEPGQVYVTPERGAILGYKDKLEFYELSCKHSQTLTMGEKITSTTNRPIQEVSFVMCGDYIYEEGIDFEIDVSRHHLNWLSSDKPKAGSKLSILYLTTPEYVITDMSHELRSIRHSKGLPAPQTVDMPNQYIARRLDFVYGETINKKRDEVTRFKEEEKGFSYE